MPYLASSDLAVVPELSDLRDWKSPASRPYFLAVSSALGSGAGDDSLSLLPNMCRADEEEDEECCCCCRCCCHPKEKMVAGFSRTLLIVR